MKLADEQLIDSACMLTQLPVKDNEHVFSPDGTGLSTSMKQNYENDCRKEGKKMGV